MNDFMLQMKSISKSFPGVRALDNISFNVRRGEIHALLGENGAGKSTLIKIIAGIYHPDEGEIYIDGEKIDISDVQTAKAAGISVIHQELSMCKNMTVAENIFLGNMPVTKIGLVDDNKLWEGAKGLLDSIGLKTIDPDTPVSTLSVAMQQMVEICRSLSSNSRLLIMDEPTASLATAEVDLLHGIMGSLKEKGVTIIYISHKLNEIFNICDHITVMRDGKYIGDSPIADISYNKLINMMVGRDIADVFPVHSTNPGELIFEVNHIRNERVHDVSFNVRRGEVVGFYGLMGAGRSEIMRALIGVDKADKGRIRLENRDIVINNPVDAIKAGIVLAPEDRKIQGLFLLQSIDFNITLPIISRLIKFLRLNLKLSDNIVEGIGKRLRIKTSSYETRVNNLSGGNQQKVVLAKWLVTKPKILILDEPTRGIDVGAKQEIYKLIYEIVKTGVSVILISSEMPEIISLCDRVYVLHEGDLTGLLDRDRLTEQNVIQYAIGGTLAS
jgi:ABC-type sugar transport system ATPase subunit